MASYISPSDALYAKTPQITTGDKAIAKENSYLFSEALDHICVLVVILDKQGRIHKINRMCKDTTGFSYEEIKERLFWDVFAVRERAKELESTFLNDLKTITYSSYKFSLISKSGKEKLITWTFSVIPDSDGDVDLLVATGIDITECNKTQERFRYLIMHDPVTGLYSRAYFEEEMKRLENSRHHPIGLIIGDMDGLKLINDTLGHEAGDTALTAMAKLLRDSFRQEDVVARIGGDEFAILLPRSSHLALKEACQRIQEAIKAHNAQNCSWPLSISLGFAIREDQHKTMTELFKEADNHMYGAKQGYGGQARCILVDNLKKSLLIRNNTTQLQANQLGNLLREVGEDLQLPSQSRVTLELLARYHDIGTVGVPENIIKKAEPLTPEEFNQIKRHCEIGFRIAWSVPELAPIAELILKHHEQWDGRGYPLGLKGEEIPLECRIFSFVSAYVSMTGPRPYKDAYIHETAVQELMKDAGKRYDPDLVPFIIKTLKKLKYT